MRLAMVLLMLTLTVACCATTAGVGTAITGWDGAYGVLQASLLRMTAGPESHQKVCSAVVLDHQNGYALTAGHCVTDGPISLNGHVANVIKVDAAIDLAILQTDALDARDASFRLTPVGVGEEVAYAGYGFGVETPMMTFGHIASLGEASLMNSDKSAVRGLLFDGDVMRGLSGGMVVDRHLQVVSIVRGVYSDGVGHIDLGVASADLLAFTVFYRVR